MTPQDDRNREIGEIAKSTIQSMSEFISKHSDDSEFSSLINDLGYAIYQVNQWFDYLKFQDAYFTLRDRELEDLNKAMSLENQVKASQVSGIDPKAIEEISPLFSSDEGMTREELITANDVKNAAIVGSNWSIDDEDEE